MGCLDLSLAVTAQAPAPPSCPVVTVRMGNACRHRVGVDLGRMRVLADYGSGQLELLDLYDPGGEIHRGTLGGHFQGTERLAACPVHSGEDPPVRLCVDLSHVSLDAGPHSVAPICFAAATPGGALEPVDGEIGARP